MTLNDLNGMAPLPTMTHAVGHKRERVTMHVFLSGVALTQRVNVKDIVSGVRALASRLKADDDDAGVWVVAEPVEGEGGVPRFELGSEVTLKKADLLGESRGVHLPGDDVEVFIEYEFMTDIPKYVERKRRD